MTNGRHYWMEYDERRVDKSRLYAIIFTCETNEDCMDTVLLRISSLMCLKNSALQRLKETPITDQYTICTDKLTSQFLDKPIAVTYIRALGTEQLCYISLSTLCSIMYNIWGFSCHCPSSVYELATLLYEQGQI